MNIIFCCNTTFLWLALLNKGARECEPYANRMQTVCEPHANRIRTGRKRYVDRINKTVYSLYGDRTQTVREPYANHMVRMKITASI